MKVRLIAAGIYAALLALMVTCIEDNDRYRAKQLLIEGRE